METHPQPQNQKTNNQLGCEDQSKTNSSLYCGRESFGLHGLDCECCDNDDGEDNDVNKCGHLNDVSINTVDYFTIDTVNTVDYFTINTVDYFITDYFNIDTDYHCANPDLRLPICDAQC